MHRIIIVIPSIMYNMNVRILSASFMIILLLNLTASSVFCNTQVPVRATIVVPGQYSTIQAAINAAQNYDTIIVGAGTYYENIVVNKPLTIQSTSGAIIDGSGGQSVISVSSANVTISGFNLRNALFGIYIDQSHNLEIRNNIITNTIGHDNTAIDCHSSYECTIVNNIITNDFSGIHLTDCNHFIVSNNSIYDNGNYVIRILTSSSCSVFSNTLDNNYIGIQIVQSQNNVVYNNTISNNALGIWIEHTSTTGNRLYYNNIINNQKQLTLGSTNNIWDDGHNVGNYWSDYTGIDSNSDGIGDTLLPHQNVDYYPLMQPFNQDIQPEIPPTPPASDRELGSKDYVYYQLEKALEDVDLFLKEETAIPRPDGSTKWIWLLSNDNAMLELIGQQNKITQASIAVPEYSDIVSSFENVVFTITFLNFTVPIWSNNDAIITQYVEDRTAAKSNYNTTAGNRLVEFLYSSDLHMYSYTVYVIDQAFDSVPPQITDLDPATNSIITIANPEISALFSDNYGINRSSIIITVDSNVVNPSATIYSFGFSYKPQSLNEGSHTVSVYLKDIAGNGATQTWTFSIQLPNYTNWIIAGVIGVAIVVLVIALLKRKPKAASQVVSPAIPSQTATTSSEAPKTSVIHCTNCGTENNSGATYCIKCGKPILRPE